MAETFSSILIIDWRRLQDPTAKSKGLDDLREAIFVVGFLYLTNHGLEVRSLTFRSMLANTSRISFEKSTQHYLADFKARCDMINSRSFVGKQYDFGTPRMKTWTEDQGIWWWLEGNSQQFMQYVSKCLSLLLDTFVAFKGNFKQLKFIKYPQALLDSQGVGPHKNSSWLFTFLSQDNTSELQVLNKSGDWINAPPIEGSLIVNIQQGLETVTGGICAATTHRVFTRYSIPFFLGVRMDPTTEQLRESAAHIVDKIPVSDDRKKRAVDVPSKFLSPLYSCFGEAYLRNRILSPPERTEAIFIKVLYILPHPLPEPENRTYSQT
ncbi:uncharacterized protein BDV14DRAFT_190662 [Aspergillus stella-maris]|uniref:uncharacterized protein n=1 Tax=Aspergillus stella-maris TaxID=1810926 RepID=UPI003CCDFC1D